MKWYGNAPRRGNCLSIGIVDEEYNGLRSYVGGCSHSFCFDYNDHNDTATVHNHRIMRPRVIGSVYLGKGGVKDSLKANEKEDNMYFVMQVDFVTNRVSFFGVPFENVENTSFSIQHMEKPFRIAASFWGEIRNSIGLGIVKL